MRSSGSATVSASEEPFREWVEFEWKRADDRDPFAQRDAERDGLVEFEFEPVVEAHGDSVRSDGELAHVDGEWHEVERNRNFDGDRDFERV